MVDVLGCMDLDMALEEDEPSKPIDDCSGQEMSRYVAKLDKWELSDKKCIRVMKHSILENFRGVIPDEKSAKDFLQDVSELFF